MCARHVTTDAESKELKDAPHTPFTDKPLPYDYGLNLTHGTPQYRRAAAAQGTSRERERVTGRQERARRNGRRRPRRGGQGNRGREGEKPWYLSDDPRSAASLEGLKGDSQLVERRMVRGFYVALDQIILPLRGQDVAQHAREAHSLRSPPRAPVGHRLRRVWVGHDDEPRKLPLAFVLRGSNRYSFPEGKGPTRGDAVARFSIIQLSGKSSRPGAKGFSETTEGYFLRDEHMTFTKPGFAAARAQTGRKWIDVNPSTQSLVAFEGDKPVFATIVSTGRHDDNDPSKDHKTPSGSFRIREKHVSNTMDDDTCQRRPLPPSKTCRGSCTSRRGTRCTARFGIRLSAKNTATAASTCSPSMRGSFFAGSASSLPDGWHAVRGTSDNEGTRVVVHD